MGGAQAHRAGGPRRATVTSCTCRPRCTDDEIVAALEPYVAGDCLVAIDAPLIVTNATGNRPAEAALNKDFARFDAGAHPSNTGKPEFRDPRGARIAARLGLDMNPRSGRSRRAIEVYPHPATVALFRLGRTLKYKNKPGRDLEQLRSELIVLVGLLEGLATADPPLHVDGKQTEPRGAAPPWSALRSAVETAGRKSELRVVEDQVDAVVCAYVALFADPRPGPHHDVRRLRDRLHRHPDAARGPPADAARSADRARRTATPAARRCASTPSCSRRCAWPPSSSWRW